MVLPIILTNLFEDAQKEKAQFNRSTKRMDFEVLLKLLLDTIHDEKIAYVI